MGWIVIELRPPFSQHEDDYSPAPAFKARYIDRNGNWTTNRDEARVYTNRNEADLIARNQGKNRAMSTKA